METAMQRRDAGPRTDMVGEGRVSRVVEGARRRMRAAATLRGTCRWTTIALGIWLVFFVIDNVLALPSGLRLPVSIAGGALLLIVFIREVLLPVLRPLRPERVAVLLENHYGIKDNLLINAFQFERRQFGAAEKSFAGRAVASCEAAVGGMDIGELWEFRRLWPWLAGAVAVLLGWFAYGLTFPQFLTNAGQRFALPLAEIAPPGSPIVTITPAGEIIVAEGDSIEVLAEIIDRRPIAADRDSAPVIVWIENARSVPTVRGKGEEANMLAAKGRPGVWTHSFSGIRRPLAFRVFAAGTQSDVGIVKVYSLPKITASLFHVKPPAYTDLEPSASAGPPATLSALAGSTVEMELSVEPGPRGVRWRDSSGTADLAQKEGKWKVSRVFGAATSYELEAQIAQLNRSIVIARSQIQIAPDNAPRVEFVSTDRNRFAYPGTTVALSVRAGDDFGLKGLWVTTRPVGEEASSRTEVKRWDYLGPPGPKGDVTEKLRLVIDPTQFRVGDAYLVEAWVTDFNPKGKPVASRPIVIRIRSPMESDLDRGDPLVRAFERLRQSLAAQERGIGLTGNLRGHLDEAVAKQDLHEHRRAIGEAQGASAQAAKESLDSFLADDAGKTYAVDLAPLVNGEMSLVLSDVEKLNLAEAAGAATVVEQILERQTHIRDALLALLGKIAEERKGKLAAQKKPDSQDEPNARESAKDVRAKLRSFIREQQKIIGRSKDLAAGPGKAKGPGATKEIAELARRETSWAKALRAKTAEIAKKEKKEAREEGLVRELEKVTAQVEAAADALYRKEPGEALPHEQESLDAAARLAEQLRQQLAEDNREQAADSGPKPADEAADAAGKIDELLDQQNAIGTDIEKVGRELSRASQKAEGRPAQKDGTDAPGGQHLEFDGRSDGGIPGLAVGEMAGDKIPKGDQPAGAPRLTADSMKEVKAKDHDRSGAGSGTGGGKASGISGQGVAGRTPAPPDNLTERLAEKQMQIRQSAEKLAMSLRSRRIATGDLESSVAAMRRVERALQTKEGPGIASAYSQALDTLEQSREALGNSAAVLRERSSLLPEVRSEIMAGVKDGVPRGYDEMVSAYFSALAEGKTVGGEPARTQSNPAVRPPR